jgi:GT2 family glycosyltransferase
VAAVVLNWNGRADTERCVRSLLAPGGPDRVLVLDNGSRGDEAGALRAAFAGEGRVEVAGLPRNRGFAGGVNEGMRRVLGAGAAEVLLINNDAVLEPGALPALRAALRGEPRAAAAGPLVLLDDGSGRAWFAGGRIVVPLGQVLHPGHGRVPAAPAGGARASGFLTFCALLLRREAWEGVGPLEEEFFAYGEDADWCLRARAAGRTLLHVPGARVLHRGSASAGVRSPLQAYLLARARVLLVRRHSGALSRALLFWPWMLLVRGPHDFLKALLTRGFAAARAGVAGVRDGARGGPPLRFRAELGLGEGP